MSEIYFLLVHVVSSYYVQYLLKECGKICIEIYKCTSINCIILEIHVEESCLLGNAYLVQSNFPLQCIRNNLLSCVDTCVCLLYGPGYMALFFK